MPALQWFHTEEREGRTYVFDPLRRREVALTPEEEVRQQVLYLLVEGLKVPAGLVAVEYSLKVNGMDRRADVVVFGKEGRPLMVVECKAPAVALTEAVLDQAVRYHSVLGPRYILLTNGVPVTSSSPTAAAPTVSRPKAKPSVPWTTSPIFRK